MALVICCFFISVFLTDPRLLGNKCLFAGRTWKGFRKLLRPLWLSVSASFVPQTLFQFSPNKVKQKMGVQSHVFVSMIDSGSYWANGRAASMETCMENHQRAVSEKTQSFSFSRNHCDAFTHRVIFWRKFSPQNSFRSSLWMHHTGQASCPNVLLAWEAFDIIWHGSSLRQTISEK